MRFSLRRRSGGRHETVVGERTVELVDARSGHEVHLLTQDALADGMKTAAGKYIALCGVQVIAASMLVPANRKRCVDCLGRTAAYQAQRFPAQRTRTRNKAAAIQRFFPLLDVVPRETETVPAADVRPTPADRRQFALSRVDGRVHRLSRVGLEGSGTAACGQQVHTRELAQRPAPDREGLCGRCWGLLPTP